MDIGITSGAILTPSCHCVSLSLHFSKAHKSSPRNNIHFYFQQFIKDIIIILRVTDSVRSSCYFFYHPGNLKYHLSLVDDRHSIAYIYIYIFIFMRIQNNTWTSTLIHRVPRWAALWVCGVDHEVLLSRQYVSETGTKTAASLWGRNSTPMHHNRRVQASVWHLDTTVIICHSSNPYTGRETTSPCHTIFVCIVAILCSWPFFSLLIYISFLFFFSWLVSYAEYIKPAYAPSNYLPHYVSYRVTFCGFKINVHDSWLCIIFM